MLLKTFYYEKMAVNRNRKAYINISIAVMPNKGLSLCPDKCLIFTDRKMWPIK